MLNNQTKQLIREYFDYLSQLEYGAEQYRNQICSIEQFEPFSFWSHLTQGEHQMSLLELKDQYPCLPTQGLAGIYIFFDRNNDGKLDYNDFYALIAVNDNLFLRQELTFRKCQKPAAYLKISNYFEQLLQYFCEQLDQLYQIKKQIIEQIDYNVYFAYQIIKDCQIDRYSNRILTREYTHNDKNTIQFTDFYRILSNKDNWPINEMYSLMDGSIQTAQQVMNTLYSPKVKKSNSDQKKFKKDKIRFTNYFSVQTQNNNYTLIPEPPLKVQKQQ